MGLVQREIEAAGLATIILTPVPALSQAVCVPRTAAIEYPLGRTLGHPGDAAGQLAVLRATLNALQTIREPGGIVNLPFKWTGEQNPLSGQEPEPPPIVRHITSHLWQLPRLLRRDIPERV